MFRVCKSLFLWRRFGFSISASVNLVFRQLALFAGKVSGWFCRFVKSARFLRSAFWVNFGFDSLKLASLAMSTFGRVKSLKLASLRWSKFWLGLFGLVEQSVFFGQGFGKFSFQLVSEFLKQFRFGWLKLAFE